MIMHVEGRVRAPLLRRVMCWVSTNRRNQSWRKARDVKELVSELDGDFGTARDIGPSQAKTCSVAWIEFLGFVYECLGAEGEEGTLITCSF